MPHLGLLVHLVERESAEHNWPGVLGILECIEPLVKPDDRGAHEFLHFHRGLALLELDRHREAAGSLEHLVSMDADNPEHRLLLADALIRSEQWEAAASHLQAGLHADPRHPGCLCALGWTLYQGQDKSAGRSLLEQAVGIHPHYFPGHLDLGLIYAAEARWDESEGHLRRALALAPEDVEVQEILEAVLHNRAQDSVERLKVQALLGALRAARRRLRPHEFRTLRTLRRKLRSQGASHLEVLLAERLWADFSTRDTRRARLDPAWAAAVAYAILRLNEREATQAGTAAQWSVATHVLGHRYRRLRDTLGVGDGDPRYCALAVPTPALRSPAARGAVGGTVVAVDFVARRRLDATDPHP